MLLETPTPCTRCWGRHLVCQSLGPPGAFSWSYRLLFMVTMPAQKHAVGHTLHCRSISATNDAIGHMQLVGQEGESAAAFLREAPLQILCLKQTAGAHVSAHSKHLLVLLHSVMVLLKQRFTLLLPAPLARAGQWLLQLLTAALCMKHSQAGNVFPGLILLFQRCLTSPMGCNCSLILGNPKIRYFLWMAQGCGHPNPQSQRALFGSSHIHFH